jgi:hypothetical protein
MRQRLHVPFKDAASMIESEQRKP